LPRKPSCASAGPTIFTPATLCIALNTPRWTLVSFQPSADSPSTQVEFHEPRAGDRVVTVRRDLDEAERLVQSLRRAHHRHRVEPHRAIAEGARMLDRRERERTP